VYGWCTDAGLCTEPTAQPAAPPIPGPTAWLPDSPPEVMAEPER